MDGAELEKILLKGSEGILTSTDSAELSGEEASRPHVSPWSVLIVEAFHDFDLKSDECVFPLSPYIVACIPQTNQATNMPDALPSSSACPQPRTSFLLHWSLPGSPQAGNRG